MHFLSRTIQIRTVLQKSAATAAAGSEVQLAQLESSMCELLLLIFSLSDAGSCHGRFIEAKPAIPTDRWHVKLASELRRLLSELELRHLTEFACFG